MAESGLDVVDEDELLLAASQQFEDQQEKAKNDEQ